MKTQVDFYTHSDNTKIFLLRVWLPFILFLGLSTAFWGGPHWIVVGLPPVLLALLYLTAAQVRPGERTLRCRRFFSWREVPYEEVRECKVSVAPGLGVLRLGRFVFPWGRIYFVREEPHQWLSPGGQSNLTRFINARREGRPNLPETSAAKRPDAPGRRDLTVCGSAAVVGALAALFSRTLLPDVSLQFDPQRYPHWIASYEQFQQTIASWPWNLVAGFVLLAIVIALRFKKAWGFAFAFGGVLGSFVVKMIG